MLWRDKFCFFDKRNTDTYNMKKNQYCEVNTLDKSRKPDYDSKTGMPTDETHFECGLPKYLAESLERMKKSWKIVDSGKRDYHWDICWCELNADLNSAEFENLISSEQAWYLRQKYLRIEKPDIRSIIGDKEPER